LKGNLSPNELQLNQVKHGNLLSLEKRKKLHKKKLSPSEIYGVSQVLLP
jgi:hypothetical protein